MGTATSSMDPSSFSLKGWVQDLHLPSQHHPRPLATVEPMESLQDFGILAVEVVAGGKLGAARGLSVKSTF